MQPTDCLRGRKNLDNAVIDHVLRWAPFGVPPSEEIFASFGLNLMEVADRIQDVLDGTTRSTSAGWNRTMLRRALHVLSTAPHIAEHLEKRRARCPRLGTALPARPAAKPDGHNGLRTVPNPEDTPWHLRARCRGMPDTRFFQADHQRGAERALSELRAKAVCGGCEVAAQCLDHALGWPEKYGVWGGTTPRERASIRAGQGLEGSAIAAAGDADDAVARWE